MNTTRTKQVEEVREISAITYGFMASKALFAALEFEVLRCAAALQAKFVHHQLFCVENKRRASEL